jgi:uncharacterized protein YjbI with pentapeptide repeats
MHQTFFIDLDFNKIHFEDCDLSESSFFDIKAKKSTFKNCEFNFCEFENVDFSEADFSTSKNYSIDPSKNELKNAVFSIEGAIELASLMGITVKL